MVPIKQNLVSSSMYPFKVISESIGRNWLYITVHNTANDATAENEISYMRSNNNYTSFHYAVDDKQIVQGLPDTVGAFDTSNRSFSAKGLSTEICYSKSGGARFTKAEQNAAEFIAFKLKEKNYPCDSNHVKTHQEATNKYCPHRTLDLGWARFMNLIKSYMEDKEDMTDKQVTEKIDEALVNFTKSIGSLITEGIKNYFTNIENMPRSNWAENWEAAVENNVFDGTMPRSALTREQAATIFSKMGLLKMKTDGTVPNWADSTYKKAIEHGITDGSEPMGAASRLDALTMCVNTLERIQSILKSEREQGTEGASNEQ